MQDKTEKKLKEIINYLAANIQIQKRVLIEQKTTNKLLQELINSDSKNKLFGGEDGDPCGK